MQKHKLGCSFHFVLQKDNDQDHKVRIAIGNGVRADVWKEFLNRFGRIHVGELYAATEGNVGFINYTDKVGVVGRINILSKVSDNTFLSIEKSICVQSQLDCLCTPQVFFPFSIIKFDIEKEEPVRNAEGLCIPVGKGKSGASFVDFMV